MKITNSGVTMASTHEYESRVTEERTSLLYVNDAAAKEASTPLRGRVDRYTTSVKEAEKRSGGTAVWTRPENNQAESALAALTAAPKKCDALTLDRDKLEDVRANVLRKMLELLRGVRDSEPLTFGELTRGRTLDLRSASYRAVDARVQLFHAAPQAGTTAAGTLWKQVTETSVTRSERECTTFQSQGFALTEDGRAINFDVSFSMSRAFTSNYSRLQSENVVMTDPLIINLDNGVTSLSGQKFDFDLDADGQTESVSFAGSGSGFLALDANGNGVIDDGSELFGTQSGDGFADLAAYDDDGNGWIDENDAVYSDLRVWTKDADGGDRLMSLQEADVGAIYLDSVGTQYALKNAATGATDGAIRRTGVYLKESGGVGTLSHVDLSS